MREFSRLFCLFFFPPKLGFLLFKPAVISQLEEEKELESLSQLATGADSQGLWTGKQGTDPQQHECVPHLSIMAMHFSQLPYSTSDPTIFKQDYGFGDGGRDLALPLKVEDVAFTAFYKETKVATSFS